MKFKLFVVIPVFALSIPVLIPMVATKLVIVLAMALSSPVLIPVPTKFAIELVVATIFVIVLVIALNVPVLTPLVATKFVIVLAIALNVPVLIFVVFRSPIVARVSTRFTEVIFAIVSVPAINASADKCIFDAEIVVKLADPPAIVPELTLVLTRLFNVIFPFNTIFPSVADNNVLGTRRVFIESGKNELETITLLETVSLLPPTVIN